MNNDPKHVCKVSFAVEGTVNLVTGEEFEAICERIKKAVEDAFVTPPTVRVYYADWEDLLAIARDGGLDAPLAH